MSVIETIFNDKLAPCHSTEYLVLPQDPILGIRKERIASKITLQNWQQKALMQCHQNENVYIYIAQGEIAKLNRKVYCATGYSPKKHTTLWQHYCYSPVEAINWLNQKLDNTCPTSTCNANVENSAEKH